jgi:hypothetical protein
MVDDEPMRQLFSVVYKQLVDRGLATWPTNEVHTYLVHKQAQSPVTQYTFIGEHGLEHGLSL